MEITVAPVSQANEPTVTVEDGHLVIKAKIDPRNSAGGKSILISSFSGFVPLQVDGKQLRIGLNATIKR